MPVTLVNFTSWIPDGGDVGPDLAVADNVIPVHKSHRVVQGQQVQAQVTDGPVTGALVHMFQQARIVQYSRPDADTSPGIWQPSSGTQLFAVVNDSTPNDANYIYAPNAPVAAVVVLALSPITNPAGLTSGHVVQYRYAIPAVAAFSYTGTDVSFSSTGNTIAAAGASFSQLGVGQTVTTSVTNNGHNTFTVVTVAAHSFTVSQTLVNAAAGSSITVATTAGAWSIKAELLQEPAGTVIATDAFSSTGTDVSFTAATSTIASPSASFATLLPGQVVRSSVANNGNTVFNVVTVAAHSFTVSQTLVNAAAGPSVTLTTAAGVQGVGPQPGFTLHTIPLTTAQAASITDFSQLALRLTATVPGNIQQAFPVSDASLGGWQGNAGQSPLYPILATGPQTSNWIVSPVMAPGAAAATYDAGLTPGSDPKTRLFHTLKYQYLAVGNGMTLAVSIFQGSTLIATDTILNATTAAWTTRSYTLTAAQATNITDYTLLSAAVSASYPTDVAPTAIQQLQPSSTTSSNFWTPVGAATLHQCVNEPTPNDATYMQTQDGSHIPAVTPQVQFQIPPVTPPGSTNYLTLRIRGASTGPARIIFNMYLRVGTANVAFVSLDTSSTSFQTASYTLATSEAARIAPTDWASGNLNLFVTATFSGGIDGKVSWVDFEVPQPKQLQVSYLELDEPSTSMAEVSWADYEAPDPLTSYKGDVPTLYAGTPTKLYTVSTSGFAQVGSGYAAGNAHAAGWQFLQVGADCYATNYVDPIQIRTAGAGNFANLITDPSPAPQARHMAIIRNQLVLGDVNLTNFGPDWLWWSAVNNFTSFTPSLTTQAGNGRVYSTPGQIMALVGGDNGIVFKRNAIHSLTWTGDQAVFRLDEITRSVGTPYPRSVVLADDVVYFWGGSSFWKLDPYASGDAVQRVGDEVLAAYMSDPISSPVGALQPYDPPDMASEDQYMVGWYDRLAGLVFWEYQSVNDTAYAHTKRVCYSPTEDRWTTLTTTPTCYGLSQPNVNTSDTHPMRGTIGFDYGVLGAGVTAWYKYSGVNTLTATLKTQRRAIGLDKQDMPIGPRQRGYTYVPDPKQDYPIRCRLRTVMPLFSATPGFPSGAPNVSISLTVECSNDFLVRPGSGSYRSVTYTNLKASETFEFPFNDLEGFWFVFTVTLGPMATPAAMYAFHGLYVSWEPRTRP